MKTVYLGALILSLTIAISGCNSGSSANRGGPSDNNQLSVETTSPLNGEANVSIYSDIIIKFNQVVPNLTRDMITINESSPTGNLVPIYSIQAESNTNIYKIRLAAPLNGLTDYFVTLNAGITAVNGKHLESATIHFTTRQPQWSPLGESISISKPALFFPNMGLSSDGTPYILTYQQVKNSDGSISNTKEIFIKKYSEVTNSWNQLGLSQIPTGLNDGLFLGNIAISSTNTPYIVYQGSDASAVVKQYINNSWQQVGGELPFSIISTAAEVADAAQAAVAAGTKTSAQAASEIMAALTAEAAAKANLGYIALSISPNGKLYTGSFTGYMESANLKISGYDLSRESWQQIGDYNGFSNVDRLAPVEMLVTANNKIFLGYFSRNPSIINVKAYDSSTHSWTTVGNGLSTQLMAGKKFFSLAIAPNGTPYIAYYGANLDSSNISIKKYVNENWVTIPAPNRISVGAIKLVITNKNNMYLVFSEKNSKLVRVMQYHNESWVMVGNNNSVAGDGANLFISDDGIPYIATYNNVNGTLSIMKFY